jgi:hypothetical protein
MNQQSKQLQTPFLQPDLLTLSSFISYCRDNSVLTDKKELEYFDQERLLVPAARVLRGVVKYRSIYQLFDGATEKEWRYVYVDDLKKFKYEKLDPKTYYDQGAIMQSAPGIGLMRGFHFGNDGWLDWYLERDMVVYPAKEGYKPWKKFSGGPSWSTNKKLFDDVSELMYAKHQIYPLQFIKNRRTLKVVNQGLFRTPEAWSKAGDMITKVYTEGESNERIQERVGEWNKFFAFYNEVRELRIGKNKMVSEVYTKSLDGYDGDNTEALADARASAEQYDKEAISEAQVIVKKHEYTLQDIQDWRFHILGFGSFGTGTKSRKYRNYVARLENSVLNSTEDTYEIVNELSWLVELLGGQSQTAKQLILNSYGDSCIYCGKGFTPTRSNQVTCGSKECKQKQRNEHKREATKYRKARARTTAP